MKTNRQRVIELRVKNEAIYTIENNATVRETAKVFGFSKSTVHQDLTVRLKELDLELYNEVMNIISENKEERAIRGGKTRWNKLEG